MELLLQTPMQPLTSYTVPTSKPLYQQIEFGCDEKGQIVTFVVKVPIQYHLKIVYAAL